MQVKTLLKTFAALTVLAGGTIALEQQNYKEQKKEQIENTIQAERYDRAVRMIGADSKKTYDMTQNLKDKDSVLKQYNDSISVNKSLEEYNESMAEKIAEDYINQ
jgi:hypothetical protein